MSVGKPPPGASRPTADFLFGTGLAETLPFHPHDPGTFKARHERKPREEGVSEGTDAC